MEVPGVRAADKFGDDGEHAGWMPGTSASNHRLELGGRDTKVGGATCEGRKGVVEVRGVERGKSRSDSVLLDSMRQDVLLRDRMIRVG